MKILSNIMTKYYCAFNKNFSPVASDPEDSILGI